MSISRFATAVLIAFSGTLAFAADDIDGAVVEKSQQAVVGAAEAAVVRTTYSFLYSKPLQNTGLLGAKALDSAMISKVLAKVDGSFFPTLGFRQFGGARVVITTDLAQVANSAGLQNIQAALASREVALPVGAPVTEAELKAAVQTVVTELSPAQFRPKFGKTVINVRTATLAEDLATLKNMGALVQEIEVKTTIPRLGGYAVAAFNLVLVGGAALDAYTASSYAFQSQYPEAGNAWKLLNCEETATADGQSVYDNCAADVNWVKRLVQSSPLAIITAVMPN